MVKIFRLISYSFLFFSIFYVSSIGTQVAAFDASKVEIFLSPRMGSFIEGSTFDVPIFINTNGVSINSVEVKVNYDKDKLVIVKPSGGVSIVGVWTESPSYNNLTGTASYSGTIPEGIITESGLIGNITFKAIGTGRAIVTINSASKVVFDDDLDTIADLDLGRADYNILKKETEGVHIFSETNPLEGKWYNNNTPVLSWDRDSGVSGFSFILDDKPNTIPDNTVDSDVTSKSFEELHDGLWYFHVKANKGGSWSTTGHFLLRIDTAPPSDFELKSNFLAVSVSLIGKTLVSFFTIDNLSGVDHYEVGTIDEDWPVGQSPVFVETGSPFQIPIFEGKSLRMIVRAIDKAGNVRESFKDVRPPFDFFGLVKDYWVYIFIAIVLLILYYLNKYHVINPFRRFNNFNVVETDIKNYLEKRREINQRNISEQEKIHELQKDLEKIEDEIKHE